VTSDDLGPLELLLVVRNGEAQLESASLGQKREDQGLIKCLLDKIGLTRKRYSVPGEVDACIMVRWPVEVS
jgi:hypothetical protein